MADISEDVKNKVAEKNVTNLQSMDRTRSESNSSENVDTVSNTLQPPNLTSSGQIMPPQVRKKTSSFQITSVTQSRLSHDGGEDSADDLDESHTEDLSSELIDCSKTTDIDNDGASSEDFSASTGGTNIDDSHGGVMFGGVSVTQGNVTIGVPVPILINAALSIATTNSTSAVTTVPLTVTSDIPPVVPVVTELVVELSDQQQQWENRFKVVKIVNNEPFNRGRWLVMDYTDNASSAQAADTAKSEPNAEGAGSGNSSAGSSVHYVPGENHPSENPIATFESSQSTAPQPSIYVNQSQANSSQQQSEYSTTNINQNSNNAQSIVAANSNLPASTSQVAPVQQSSHPVVPHAPSTDPPTVIVQEANVVPIPTEQTNVPQIDDKDTSKVGIKDQLSLVEPMSQNTPVLKPLLDSLPDTLGVSPKTDEATDGDEAESASGSSTVAIDNKIEQAMDLVKSHLMFAVREEVDVLKEKITELVEKISQLEFENGILKASASQETLNKLSQQQQQQQPPQNSIQQNTQTQSPPLQQSSTVHS